MEIWILTCKTYRRIILILFNVKVLIYEKFLSWKLLNKMELSYILNYYKKESFDIWRVNLRFNIEKNSSLVGGIKKPNIEWIIRSYGLVKYVLCLKNYCYISKIGMETLVFSTVCIRLDMIKFSRILLNNRFRILVEIGYWTVEIWSPQSYHRGQSKYFQLEACQDCLVLFPYLWSRREKFFLKLSSDSWGRCKDDIRSAER